MSSEERHLALPTLYGAPAYARPPRPIEEVQRPIDPDDLPLEFLRTPDEHELAARMTGSAFAPTLVTTNGHGPQGGLQGRPFLLRSLTGRLFRNS
ncbi:MAG: hypothetical protein QOF11_892 [Chloroflexota bacterium]|nr:hypothetical protein [Chloroflexota bacterium]